MVHSVPMITCIINSLITNTVIHRGIIKPICWFTPIYSVINFIGTKINGAPLYAFLHWESMETPLLICGILGTFVGIYFGLCFLDEKVKWQLVKNRTEKMAKD